MRATVGKAVRKELARVLAERLPQFEPDQAPVVPVGWRCWRWSPSGDLHLFVLLEPRQLSDDFSLVCAWNVEPTPPDAGDGPPESDRGSFLLHTEWAPRQIAGWSAAPGAGVDDLPDPLAPAFGDPGPAEDALARVPALVADAVDKLVAHGLPRLGAVAEAHGHTLDDSTAR